MSISSFKILLNYFVCQTVHTVTIIISGFSGIWIRTFLVFIILLKMNNLDPDMRSLFDMAGITNDQLQDEETRKAIYNVIEQQGGMDAVKRQVKSRPIGK